MPIQVQLPDGSIGEFPDGMPDAEIERVLQAQFGVPQSAQAQPDALARYARAAGLTAPANDPRAQFAGKTMAERYAAQGIDPNQYSSTKGQSAYENFMAGAGKSVMDSWNGLRQLGGAAADAIPGVDLTDWRKGVQDEIDENRRIDRPLMDTTAGIAGNIAGATAQAAIPVGGWAGRAGTAFGKAAPYIGSATRGAAFSAAQPISGGESRGKNALFGGLAGVAGQGIASGAGALSRGAVKRADAYTQALADKAEQFGLKLGIPNFSENPLVRTMASQMERLPFSGAGRRATRNQRAFNREVGKSIGEPNANKITPTVFADAKGRIGQVFNDLTNRNSLSLNTQHIADVRSVVDEATNLGGAELGSSIKKWAGDLFSRADANGVIPGAAYKSFDSKLGKILAMGGEKAHYLGQLRDVIRNAFDSSISAGDRAAWQTARQQWAALKTIEPLVAKSGNGNISPALLMGRVTANSAGKARMASGGGGDLGDLARVGQRFLKESPDSGSADRLLVNTLVGSGLFGAQHAGLIDPSTAAYLGAGLLANRGALGALYSRALTSGGSPVLTGVSRGLLAAPAALPAIVNARERLPLEVDVVGGRLGPAPTDEEMAALRARMGQPR